jgi:hypothetical protein
VTKAYVDAGDATQATAGAGTAVAYVTPTTKAYLCNAGHGEHGDDDQR